MKAEFSTPAVQSISEHGRWFFPTAHVTVDTGGGESSVKPRTEREVVDSNSGVTLERAAKVIPMGLDGFGGVQGRQRVRPALRDKR